MNKLLIVFLSLFLSAVSAAQQDNALLEHVNDFRSTTDKKWWLEADVRISLLNKEYFNVYQDGYTLFGYWLSPSVVWKPAPDLLLKAGVWNGLQYGARGFGDWQPTLSLVYSKNNWRVIAGTLEGHLNHRLLEPMMDFERVIVDPVEQGLQVKYVQGRKFWDLWVDWQQNTGPGRSQQELIWVGQHLTWPLITRDSIWELAIDLQGSAYHAGGQNLALPLPVNTWFNGSAGLRLKRRLGAARLEFSPYVLGAKEDDLQGWALYPTFGVQWKGWQWWAMYWSGNNYSHPMGGDLFQNISRKFGAPGLVPGSRTWILLRIYWEKIFTNRMVLSFRLEPVIDLKNGQVEHSAGVYFRYPMVIP